MLAAFPWVGVDFVAPKLIMKELGYPAVSTYDIIHISNYLVCLMILLSIAIPPVVTVTLSLETC